MDDIYGYLAQVQQPPNSHPGRLGQPTGVSLYMPPSEGDQILGGGGFIYHPADWDCVQPTGYAGSFTLSRADWDCVQPTRGWLRLPIPGPPTAGWGGSLTLSRADSDCVQPPRGSLYIPPTEGDQILGGGGPFTLSQAD